MDERIVESYNAHSNIIITVPSIDLHFLVIPLPSSSRHENDSFEEHLFPLL